MAKKKKKIKRKSKKKKVKKIKKIRRRIKKSKKSKKITRRKSKRLHSKALVISKDNDGNSLIKVSDSWANQAYVNDSKYKKKYKLSIKDNDKFWTKEGKRISWIKKYSKIKDIKYSKDEVKIKWFYDGTLNASVNCIDRHLKKKSQQNRYNMGRR